MTSFSCALEVHSLTSLNRTLRSILLCLFQAFFGGRGNPSKKLTSPQKGSELCAVFFGRESELQICHRSFLLIDNKHRKLFTIKQSNGCKFMSKMHRNTFVVRVPFMRFPSHPSRLRPSRTTTRQNESPAERNPDRTKSHQNDNPSERKPNRTKSPI